MKTDRLRLERIYELGNQLQEVMKRRGITAKDIEEDLETQWLITTPLFNIGEQVNCLSDEFADGHPDIPWTQIAGLRHRLVHNYEGTNWSMIAIVVCNEIPFFIEQVRSILDEM